MHVMFSVLEHVSGEHLACAGSLCSDIAARSGVAAAAQFRPQVAHCKLFRLQLVLVNGILRCEAERCIYLELRTSPKQFKASAACWLVTAALFSLPWRGSLQQLFRRASGKQISCLTCLTVMPPKHGESPWLPGIEYLHVISCRPEGCKADHKAAVPGDRARSGSGVSSEGLSDATSKSAQSTFRLYITRLRSASASLWRPCDACRAKHLSGC